MKTLAETVPTCYTKNSFNMKREESIAGEYEETWTLIKERCETITF